MRRLKVLIAAYACRPDQGSEPGVGWNLVQELAQDHEVTVLTRVNNQPAIEARLASNPLPNLQITYVDLPNWPLLRQQHLEIHLRYYLWQLSTYSVASKLCQRTEFDIVHHITYGRYCDPSFLAFLPVPFVWGPLGGGESAPQAFWPSFGWRGQVYESLRYLSRWFGERSPLVRLTARRSAVAIVATHETEQRLKTIGVKRIETIPGQTGINQQELEQLKALSLPPPDQPVRFLSLGRLLHWKGFHLGIQAFALANLEQAEYWIAGDGPERERLVALADQLAISDRIRFLGNLPRDQALIALGECSVLVHPSLHDFSPTVCLEAMAAGKPVICLDLGGPAVQITPETGIRVPALNPNDTIGQIAVAMTRLATDQQLRQHMGAAGQQRVSDLYSWQAKRQFFTQLYEQLLHESSIN